MKDKTQMPLSVAVTLARSMTQGDFTIVRNVKGSVESASLADCCAGHGGTDYCSGSICVCNDGHVCIKSG